MRKQLDSPKSNVSSYSFGRRSTLDLITLERILRRASESIFRFEDRVTILMDIGSECAKLPMVSSLLPSKVSTSCLGGKLDMEFGFEG